MQKVILTIGLQGSGKTTWAKEQIDNFPKEFKRISKDDLRSMICNGKWNPTNERIVVAIRNYILTTLLDEGFSVIVDDTNLNPVHEKEIRHMVKFRNKMFPEQEEVEVETQVFTDVPIEVCIERDSKRPNPVGEQVIRDTYDKWLKGGETE